MAAPRISDAQSVRDAYRKVKDQIAQTAIKVGRKPENIIMVAVTKNATPDQIRTLVEAGHQDFGENRVQQLMQRAPMLQEFLARRKTLGATSVAGSPTARWHMIGHLQRNKVRQVASLVKLIHSVDSLRLAEEIHSIGPKLDHPLEVLLQINVSGEESKFGVAPPAAIHLAEQIDTMVHLKLRGLMTIAPYSDNPEDSRSVFARTRDIFDDIRSAKIGGKDFNILSMGMTDDFQVAIEEGANIVRIGRAIFGEGEPEV